MKQTALGAVVGVLLTGATPECLPAFAGPAEALTPAPNVALQSIYYYAYRSTRPSTPGPGRSPALSLPAAVEVLRKDASPGDARRQRLAIAKLVGGAKVARNPGGALQLQPIDFHKAVQELAGDDFGNILDRLAVLEPSATRRDRENAAFDALDHGSVTTLAAPPACITQFPDCGDPTLEDGIVKVNFSFDVLRPFEQVIRATYPLFWHECDSTFFRNTYAALETPDHAYPKDVTGSAKRNPEQPNPMTAAGPERHWVLFEDFTTVDLSFKNLLDITERFTAPDTYVLAYDLHESINHTTSATTEPKGIAVDRGFVMIKKEGPNKTLFAGEKTIQFDDPSLNDMARVFIRELCNESMGLGSGAGVCCTPTGH